MAAVTLPASDELFERIDDCAGGAVQTLKRRWKLKLRHRLYRRSLTKVAEGLTRCGLDFAWRDDPFLLLRPLRSYLWNGLNADTRADHLVAHCAWLSSTLASEQIHTLYHQGRLRALTWTFPGQKGASPREMTADLQPGRDLGREGAMELHLRLDGQTVMRASFSVLPARAVHTCPQDGRREGHLMVVGSLQGSDGGAERVRELTHLPERTRPRDLMLNLLQGLANGWNLTGIRGVSRSAHVYSGYRGLSRRLGVDYDAMWTELGAAEHCGTHWLLPLQPVIRPESDVPSKKRAEHRRRSVLRLTVFDACADQARRGFAPDIEVEPLACAA